MKKRKTTLSKRVKDEELKEEEDHIKEYKKNKRKTWKRTILKRVKDEEQMGEEYHFEE